MSPRYLGFQILPLQKKQRKGEKAVTACSFVVQLYPRHDGSLPLQSEKFLVRVTPKANIVWSRRGEGAGKFKP